MLLDTTTACGGGHDGRESLMSSTLPEELWSDGEEHVIMETCEDDKSTLGT